jgi:chromosome transmission fidelity protein 18
MIIRDLDALATFETAASLISSMAPVRYAVRHVLDQELQRSIALRETLARQARYRAGGTGKDPAPFDDKENLGKNAKLEAASIEAPAVKRDFFGRIVEVTPESRQLSEIDGNGNPKKEAQQKVWVTFHEGLNNAVRKPLSLQEFMRGL